MSVCPVAALLLLFLFNALGANAQTVQAVVWKTPDGTLRDFAQTFDNGNTVALSWNNWSSTAYINASPTSVNLWVTSFDWALDGYNNTIQTNIDLTQPGAFPWTIRIPSSDLATNAKYVLRFIASGEPANSQSQLSSPGFVVLAPGAVASSSSTLTSTTLSTTASAALSTTASTTLSTTASVSSTLISTTASSATTSTPTNTPSKSQSASSALSTGVKVGIGVGASLGALALVGALVGLFYYRRKARALAAGTVRAAESKEGPLGFAPGHPTYQGVSYDERLTHAPGSNRHPVEMG
ncbi:hypothetical protein AOQ84DRAFT_408426 [Glonium stellatum]|uniref:Mid2 domain-containing protein n=1 Tax=Glonium stellatum TaxID=574774 RepID=A0A8E2EZD8_9PEZI|nr:hypothetical protein AOQ84DRAFT_408426 [Glonium stellatum]